MTNAEVLGQINEVLLLMTANKDDDLVKVALDDISAILDRAYPPPPADVAELVAEGRQPDWRLPMTTDEAAAKVDAAFEDWLNAPHKSWAPGYRECWRDACAWQRAQALGHVEAAEIDSRYSGHLQQGYRRAKCDIAARITSEEPEGE